MPPAEKYLPPKELSSELCRVHGLCFTPDYIRAVRQESERARDGLFVAGCAKASAVIEWLRNHPTFSRRATRQKLAA